jgi:hypothetical protein
MNADIWERSEIERVTIAVSIDAKTKLEYICAYVCSVLCVSNLQAVIQFEYIAIIITFMQCIYNYIHVTNSVSTVHSVTAIL